MVLRLLTVLVLLTGALQARAEGTYWSTRDLLRAFFPASERVTYVEVPGALVGTPAKDHYVVFVAKTGDRVDGYAVIDDELGLHQPITFGVQLGADGRVVRTEVMAYREAYGEEVRAARFLKQFNGKRAGDALRFGQDVVAISGATISSRAMTVAVQRALVLVDAARAKTNTRQASLQPPPATPPGG